MDLLKITGVHKKTGSDFELQPVSFNVAKFHKIAIAGESGSGKSTLVKLIAGLAQADGGEVLFEGVRVKGPLEKLMLATPGIAYLSQHFELKENYWVKDILNYSNHLTEESTKELFDLCRISQLLDRKTHQVSGGEKQRIALASLLVNTPRLLILDEPYSNLDLIHKATLKEVIRDVSEQLQITCMLVSHDPLDILPWADEVFVMKGGEIVQKDTPENIYRKPVNAYVARIFGRYNLIPATSAKAFAAWGGLAKNGKDIFIRPENIQLAAKNKHTVAGMVQRVSFLGNAYEVEVLAGTQQLVLRVLENTVKKGDAVHLSLLAEHVWYLG